MPNVTEANYHHMPMEDIPRPKLVGMTLRHVLAAIRTINFGSMGSLTAQLDDGTSIVVDLEPVDRDAGERTWIMGSQRIERLDQTGKLIRRYKR